MNRQIIHYKIIFTGPENDVEIRYLAMETISYHNYLYFVRKLIAVFPVLKDLPFSVNWKDKEGDIVRICTDEELTIALDEMKSDPVKKIFIIVKQQGNDTMLHPDIACDSCDHPLKGFRYKCLVCDDYELCSDCERSQTHSDHPMIRIPKPLTPDTSYGKQFTKDIPKISQHLEHLFQQTGDETSRSNNQKSLTDSKQRFKFCRNEIHNLIANLLVEKLIKHNIETSTTQKKSQPAIHSSQREPSSSTDIPARNEPVNVDVLTSGLRSLSIDVDSGGTKRDGLTKQDEPVDTTSGGQRLVTFTNPSAANIFPSTTFEAATSSEGLLVDSNPINQLVSQMDAAPIPADPTPALQAQLTPPISAVLTSTVLTPVPVTNVPTPSLNTIVPPSAPTPVPLPRLVATAPVEDSMNTYTSLDHPDNFPNALIPTPIEEDGSLDNSWSVVENEQSEISITSSDSIASIESTEASSVSSTDRSHAQKVGPYEESLMMLHTLGFEKKEWLNLVVETKEGDIREVLKFLSPVKKQLSTNLHN